MIKVCLYILCFSTLPTFAQAFLQADNSGDSYSHIDSKGFGHEVPDCKHPVIHIDGEWNPLLKKYTFVFAIHRDLDDDRCINFDRQRNEIKTDASSPSSMKGFYGDQFFHRWKFFLDSAFQPSPNFCHIHQIKAGDGPDADSPLLTITPRYNSSADRLQLIFTAPLTGVTTYLAQTNLAPFKGTWIEAFETITYADTGKYNLILKRVSDDKTLLSYNCDTLALWRAGSTFIRPKWGIYRSLLSPQYLRDELGGFADFSMYKSTTSILPAAPITLGASVLPGRLMGLSWTDKSTNEDQFRIDRSTDGVNWLYLATANVNVTAYTDTLASTGKYYYRVRAENSCGNSVFSNIASNTITSSPAEENIQSREFRLEQNYPNPFNPSTTITFSLPRSGEARLTVYDTYGKVVAVVFKGIASAGTHVITFNAAEFPSGIYYYQLVSAGRIMTRKLVVMK